jgi:hypothetical protein
MAGQAAQLDLFDQPTPPVDIQRALKAAVGRALSGCGLSRQQIAERMNELTKQAGGLSKVTPAKLDAWARPSDATHNLPAHLVHVLCLVTGSKEPIEVMLSSLNLYPVGPRERLYIVAAQEDEASKKAARRARAAWQVLEEMKR